MERYWAEEEASREKTRHTHTHTRKLEMVKQVVVSTAIQRDCR